MRRGSRADIDDEKAWEVVAEAIQTLMRRHGSNVRTNGSRN